MSPTGDKPGWAGDEIFASLRSYVRMTSFGRAVSDNKGFLAQFPNRWSFSPDAAFYTGRPGDMKLFPDVPVFAAEVRSENYYGPGAEEDMATKRADYFAAGCQVFGTWTCLVKTWCASTGRTTPTTLPSTAGAKPPKPGPPCRAGRCRWTTCSSSFGIPHAAELLHG